MSTSLSGACGHVSAEGLITSNANFTCQFNPNTFTYIVGYSGNIYQGYPVVSIVNRTNTTYRLVNASSEGFELTISEDESPIKAAFNFIVGSLG